MPPHRGHLTPNEEIAQAHLFVRGQVQGVYYRGTMKTQADALGARGWVRNLPDGSVEALIQAPRPTAEALIAWAHDGPRRARVVSIEVTWEPLGELEPDFAVVG